MKTALKRIIAAVAVFGALSALCYSCAPVKVSAAGSAVDDPMVDYLIDWMNETYDLYYGQIVPDAIAQDIYADAYAISMYISRAVSAAYEPDFHNSTNALLAGFYFDADNDIHVTTFYTGLAVRQEHQTFLIGASDEHYCTLSGKWPVGENGVTGYALKDSGNNAARQYNFRLGTCFGNDDQYYLDGYTISNDAGATYTVGSDYAVSVDLSRPASLCTAFPPTDNGSWAGYLEIPQSDGTSVKINPGYMPVNATDFTASDENFRNIVNNYITQNFPDSTFQVPETVPETPVETLPNDEYSGLPSGWNEINPVPLPDIQTPSAPLTDAEMDGAHDWLTDFSFWSSVQSGLAFWFAAAAHVASIDETLTGILLGVSLLSVLGYILWRWGI